MSWKKNGISYLLWVLYAVATEVGLVCLASAMCDSMKVEIRVGTIACALYIAAAGLGVFLIHRFAPKYAGADGRNHSAGTVIEAAVTVILLAIGFVLRAQSTGGAGEDSGYYYELAAVVSEGESPQSAHGAACFYIRMLHGLFYFLGNKPAAAVWAQILIQMAAMVLLYFAVRRLAGNIAAIVMLAFGMCSSYLIREATALSPAMLYLFFWAAMLLISIAVGAQRSLWGFLPVGTLIAFMSYLNVAGCLLLLVLTAVIFCEREEGPGIGRRITGLLLGLAGAAAGFAGCALADAAMSGRSFTGTVSAWLALYSPSGFYLPVSLDVSGALAEYIILFCVLTLGMFSFWRNRQSDPMKAWVLLSVVLALGGCFGVFTEEVPMGLYMYLFLAVMAGIAVEECICEVRPAALQMSLEAGAPAGGEQTAPEEGTRMAEKEEPQPSGEAAPKPRQQEKSGEPQQKPRTVQMIENPLPLPKKHIKRTMDYGVDVPEGKDNFDLEVDEKDDFDI